MINTLTIKNVALVDSLTINFGSSLNIISGETGSGKSIIMNSLGFLFGDKVTSNFIKSSSEFADVEAIFTITNKIIKSQLKKNGILIENDTLSLKRSISKKLKSKIYINDKLLTISQLKSMKNLFIDMHNQHDQTILLNPLRHLSLLDEYCGNNLIDLKKSLYNIYKEYICISNNIQDLIIEHENLKKDFDYYSFQAKEIEQANLELHEEDILLNQKKIASNFSKLITYINLCLSYLYEGSDNELSAIDKIYKSLNCVDNLSSLDDKYLSIQKKLSSVLADLEDIVFDLRSFRDNLDFDDYNIDEIETRLNIIYHLKKKYGNTIENILQYLDNINIKIKNSSNFDENLNTLNIKKDILEKKALLICDEISTIRKNTAKFLETSIVDTLIGLGISNAKFKVSFKKSKKFNEEGFDDIEFLFSANEGQPLQSLANTASGGEISRLMLALKIVLSNIIIIPTFIFDEIDTGISGRAAQKVAESLKFLSTKHQIICITHLPQIASMANMHFLIEKTSSMKSTSIQITDLNYEESINELARLIGGISITQNTLAAATEMKSFALKLNS